MTDYTPNAPTKQCTKCQESKPATLEFFSKSKTDKDGLRSWCKVCVKAYNRQYTQANKGRLTDQKSVYAKANKEKADGYKRKYAEANKGKKKEYYEANKAKILAKQSEFRKDNPELIRQRKHTEYERHKDKYIERATEWRGNNKEAANRGARKIWSERGAEISRRRKEREAPRVDEVRERKRKYRISNLDRFNERSRIYTQRRLARKRSLPDSLTNEQWLRCLSYFDNKCVSCGSSDNLQMDHWIPLNSEYCTGTIAENIVCLCPPCNYSKHDRNALEWLIEKFGDEQGKGLAQRVRAYLESLSRS